jgi:uncharacterized membrane protein YdjX (TVP38/TMEM64 family)
MKKEKERIKRVLKPIIGFKYPKLAGLLLAIILAYAIFSNSAVQDFVLSLEAKGYIGAFIAGMFFTFGFTSPFSAGFFIILNPENIWLAGIIGGFGAMLTDLVIFKFIRFSFMDEFKRLEKTNIMKRISGLIESTIGHKIKVYLLYAFAGILIASPLPDEAGVIILAGLTKIKPKALAMICFICNTIGIIILLAI